MTVKQNEVPGILHDDSVIMLTDAELPIMSFSFIGLYGPAGSGKTYTAEKLTNAYINQAKKH